MLPTPEPLEFTCFKCASPVQLFTERGQPGQLQCPRCGFRHDLDPTMFEDGWLETWPDETEADLR